MMTMDQMIARLPAMSQKEKDGQLFGLLENFGDDESEAFDFLPALLAAGAQINNGDRMLDYAIARSDSMRATNIFLDAGWQAKEVQAKNLWFLWQETDREAAYATFRRLVKAGLKDEERLKIAVSALKKGDYAYLEGYVLKPGEDLREALSDPQYALLNDTADRSDQRSVNSEDIEKYVAWKQSVDDLYAAHFGAGMTLEKLRETVGDMGMNGLALAARAGQFDAVVDFYRRNPALGFDADMFLHEDKCAQNTVKLLFATGQLRQIFAPEFWRAQPEEAMILLDGMPQAYKAELDEAKIAGDMAGLRLAGIAPAKSARGNAP
jgi:hypothetical protein